jgi:hypothetical protein
VRFAPAMLSCRITLSFRAAKSHER